MDTPENRARLEKVYKQLLEIAKGNFSYQIERTDLKDEMEALTLLVNITAEDIRDSFIHQGFVNPKKSYACVAQILFILDDSYRVEKIKSGVTKVLQFEESELVNIPFDSLLSNNSKKAWARTKRALIRLLEPEKAVQLSFRTKGGLLHPAYCNIVHFPNDSPFKGRTIVTSLEIVQNKTRIEEKIKRRIESRLLHFKKPKKFKKRLSVMDIEILRSAGDYIQKHLDAPMPLLKDLAKMLGTNEYKLKFGFKELYGMTIFQFLKYQRLSRAHVLVMNTNLPISRISQMVGFKKGNHLSREFKKRYGYNPTALRLLSK